MEAPTSKDKNEKSEIAPKENKAFNLNSSSILLNNPLDFSIIENPLEELAESKSAIIHIKNTLKNSVFNCYVNCCCGHSVIFNTFLNTPKGIKYLFQSNASINPDLYNCTFKDNIRLEARFTSLTKKNSEEISLDTGNPFTEMLKKEKSCCFDMEEILMPVNIIAENRIAGIVKIHGFPAEKCCSNKACLCLFCCMVPSLIYLSCPFCSSCQCGDCCNSDNKSSGCCKCDCCDSDSKSSGCCKCDCCNSDKKCPCCDENRCCCGLCEKSSCPCCDENRCCCGLCPKPKGSCCCCCNCTCNCCGNDNTTSNQDIKCCWDKLSYHCEILSPTYELKYHIYLTSHNCGNKCLRRRKGLDFFIADANNNAINSSFIYGRNNKNFGTFFNDSYSYEIYFPEDAEPDYKLTLLHAIYALDSLCIY